SIGYMALRIQRNFTVISNIIFRNGYSNGIELYGGGFCEVIDCVISNFPGTGIYLTNSISNRIASNIICNNAVGIHHGNDVSNNVICLNEVRDNTRAGIRFSDNATSNKIVLNNITGQATNIDHTSSGNNILLSNWFGSIKLSDVESTVIGTGTNAFIPYRLGVIGITQGDVWPSDIPTNVQSQRTTSNAVITWDISGGNPNGYRIYRSINTNTWTNFTGFYGNIPGGTVTVYTDNTIAAGNNYYYYITSYDAETFINESWWGTSVEAHMLVLPEIYITNYTANAYISGNIILAGVVTNGSELLSSIFVKTNHAGILPIELFTNITTNWYTNDFDTTKLGDGTNNFTFYVTDLENQTNTNEIKLVIDNSPPYGEVTNSTNNAVIGGSSVNISGTNYENASAVNANVLYTNSAFYAWTNASPWSFTFDSIKADNGLLELEIVISNSVGLVFTNIWTNYVSNIAPTITVLDPVIATPTWLTNSPTTITGYAESTFGAIKSLQFRTNGGTWTDVNTDPTNLAVTNVLSIEFDTNFNVDPHTNTNVIWQVRAINEYAVSGTNTYSNRVDLTPPVVSFNPQITNGVLSTVTNIKGDVAEIYDTIDGGSLVFMTNSVVRYTYPVSIANNIWSNIINTANIANDIYDIYVYITNNAKLVTIVTQTNVEVTNNPGNFMHVTPVDGGIITGALTAVTGYIDTGSFGVSNVYFKTNDGTWAKLNLAPDDTNWWTNLDTTKHADGSNAFWFMYIDDNSTTNDFHSNWYVVDNSPPSTEITNIQPGIFLDGIYTIKGTNKDIHSGIQGTVVCISNSVTEITNIQATVSNGSFEADFQTTPFNDGLYYVYAVTSNNAGLSTNTSSSYVIVNNDPPEIAVTNITQFSNISQTITFMGYATNIYSAIDPPEVLFNTNNGPLQTIT
ncbi:right-handed parallel beta-helix repeat-containing protein, partial [Spirochaetota bacterium]